MDYIKKFDSINSFVNYITSTPTNKVFESVETLYSMSVSKEDYDFRGTNTLDEAIELLKYGWYDKSVEITKKISMDIKQPTKMVQKNILSVQGYQPVIPLYLNGVPNNMVNKKSVPIKTKVLSITKLINYNHYVSKEKIEEESIKAMKIVMMLESLGYRVNLNVALGSKTFEDKIIVSVCIKKSGEKLNVSKLVFPMIHPSMLRRIMLRYIEVFPSTPYKYTEVYGSACTYGEMRRRLTDDIVLPAAIGVENVENVKSLEDVIKISKNIYY